MFIRKGERLGSVLVDKASTGPVPQPEPESAGQLTETEREADRQAAEARASQQQPDEPEDGVYAVGGGWHEVVIGGQVVDKVRGADAAQEAYEAHQGGHDGDDQLP